jgi:acyl carrier protein
MSDRIFTFINKFVRDNEFVDRDIKKEDQLKADLALDSLAVLTLADALEEEFEISIEFEDLTQTPETIQDLIDLIISKKQ